MKSALAFLCCIPIANWLIHNVGVVCLPDGPCLIPVAPGVMAPSGVLMVGVALVLRDMVHRQHGPAVAAWAIVAGAALSCFVAPAELALASGVAFLVSELADFAVYAPLARRRFFLAVAASSIVGLVVDSVLFLYLAFGSLDYLEGQVVAKTYAVATAMLALWVLRSRIPVRA